MHSLLEEYLDQVVARLGPLPVARRNDEITEMRQHLLNAVIVNREMGQNEDEAAAAAVEQCGPPEEAAQGLVWAWRRGETMRRRGFWGAAACAFVLTVFLPVLQDTPLEDPLLRVFRFMGTGGQAGPPVQLALLTLAGGICGLIFPRRAFGGIVLGVTAWHASFLAMIFVIVAADNLSSPLPSSSVTGHLVSTLLAILAAWVGSGWRNARTHRARG